MESEHRHWVAGAFRRVALGVLSTTGLAAGLLRADTSLALPPLVPNGDDFIEELRLVSDDDVVAVQVDLAFDPAEVTVTSVVKGGAAGSHLLAQRELAPGMLRAVLTSPTNAIFSDGALLAVEFESAVPLVPSDRVFSLSKIEFSTVDALGVSATLAPYVEITSPSDGAATPAQQQLAITAVAVATEGELDRVEFFAGDLKIGVSTAEPYSVNYFPTALGAGVITAVAIAGDGGSGSDAVGIDVTGTPYFAIWQAANFTPAQLADDSVSGPMGNPDGDRLPNILEYYLGLSPLESDSAGGRLAHGTVDHEGETYATLTLRKPIDVNDLAAEVATSGDLTFAAPGAAVLHSRQIDGDEEVLTYRDTVPIGLAPRRFLRAGFAFPSAP